MAAQATAAKKKFATCNLNQVLGAPKAATPKNYGPAVRSAAVIKPVAKPKGLISLGRAPPGSGINTRKGAAWSHLEEKAKERREEEDAKKDDLAKPDWAILDYEDLEKPLSKPEQKDEDDFAEGDDFFPSGENDVTPDRSYSSTRPAVTSEAASQTADDNDWASSIQGERQFSKSQRSYLSMDYAPGGGEGEQGMASEPPQTHSVAVDATGHTSRRSRTQSWADTYGSDEDEVYDFPGSGPPAGEAPSAPSAGRAAYKTQGLPPTPSSSSMVPAPAGPPPPRRPPPPGPPPPAQSDSRSHHIGAPRPVGPPPPMPPPAGPPPALARGTPPGTAPPGAEQERGPAYPAETPASPAQGSVRSPKMMPQEEPRQRSPKFSPQEDPVVHSPQLSRHEDPRGFRGGPRAGPPEDRQGPPHSRHVEPQHRPKAAAYEEPHHGYAPARQPEHHRGGARGEGGGRDHVGAPPAKHGAWGPPPRHPVPSAPAEPQRPRAPPGPGPASPGHAAGGGGPPDGCWGPAVAYTPAFAPRAPPDRPMSEDFVNSGWKEKKLWTPPEPEKVTRSPAPGAAAAGGPRSRLRGDAAGAVGQGIAGALDAGKEGGKGGDFGAPGRAEGRRPPPGGDAAEAAPPPKPPKPPKSPKGPLEALDPDSSSSDESDGPGLPPEYAVLDMNVPRTALVINVSHVLKRLNGCCSLNQLTKSIKSFKDNTGVTLEAFLRANPMTFKLEGRIVHLLGRDGEKWLPAPEEAGNYDSGKGKGKGKTEAPKGGARKTEAPKKRSTGGGDRQADQWQAESWDSGYGQSKGKNETRTKRGGASGGGGGTSWSSSGWSDWQGGWQNDRGWHW